jgi:hypothetical protein
VENCGGGEKAERQWPCQDMEVRGGGGGRGRRGRARMRVHATDARDVQMVVRVVCRGDDPR